MNSAEGGARTATREQEVLQRLQRVCAEFHVESILTQLRAGEEVLREHGVVDVAVLGQFKAGKSSFLNSLIGKNVLPVNVLPATAVITRIGYGAAEHVVIRHLSGAVEEIPLDRLAEFVTEQKNPGNEKQVSIADVELPLLEGFRGCGSWIHPGWGACSPTTRRSRWSGSPGSAEPSSP